MHTRRRSMFTSRLVNTATPGGTPRVIDDLRAAILNGDEPPGTLIPIESVADFFDVSPIPVREALKALALEGLVETRVGRNGGYFVQQPPADAVVRTLDVFIRGRRVDQQSLLETREIIEPQCAALAAQIMPERVVDPDAYLGVK